MSSSGTAKAETINLTVKQFIEGLREYTQHTDPEIVVQELQNRKDLVPLISMMRKKTNIPYYTCCSPEATHYILQYMQIYERYNPEKPLFEIGQHGLMKKLSTINDNNNWGRVGSYRRFRSHMLRKYHASNIGCAFEIINTLEGRTNGTIHETYVKLRPDKLKEIYMEHMHNVMIHPELYEGPHCGSNTLKAKVQNTVESILEQKEVNTEPHDVAPPEPRQTENNKPEHQPSEDNTPYPPTQNTSQNQSNVPIELYKEIGKLEAKIEMLEERIRTLEGGIKI